ncbi:MAG: hypothetical protein HUU15_06445 [Candidatus Brocadiae bacterium]|nr:hypothetical protein [Candidatus Brocadiia bacterium]
MTPQQIHLSLVHFPVVLPLVGLALLAAGVLLSKPALWRAALVTFVAGALIAWPVFLSGEESEEHAEHSGTVDEALLESHEDAAKIAQGGLQLLGATSLILLLVTLRSGELRRWMAAVLAVLTLATFAAVGKAAHEGGKIRHPDIRSALPPQSNAAMLLCHPLRRLSATCGDVDPHRDPPTSIPVSPWKAAEKRAG